MSFSISVNTPNYQIIFAIRMRAINNDSSVKGIMFRKKYSYIANNIFLFFIFFRLNQCKLSDALIKEFKIHTFT